jgi:hypothetical protein
MELRAAFKPMDDGSVAIVKSKLLASELIAVQTPETTHGGRIGSFISML